MNPSYLIADQIFLIGKLLKQYTETALKSYGLGSGQLQILMLLYKSGGQETQANLVIQLGIDKANVSRNVARLIDRGYVTKSDKEVRLTELGVNLKPQLVAFLQETHQLMTKGLTEAKLQVTSEVLSIMSAQLEKGLDDNEK